jgi:hypothetical protein
MSKKSTTSEFSWSGDDVVVPSVAAVAVYKNTDGDVVIRRERDGMSESEDCIIVVPREYARRIAEEINRILE